MLDMKWTGWLATAIARLLVSVGLVEIIDGLFSNTDRRGNGDVISKIPLIS